MALSKIKKKKQDKRLAARLREYELQPKNRHSEHLFTKPGSNRK